MRTQFVRDRFTWLAYLMLAFYAYMQASLGPVMPFLGEELRLNYTVRGFHFSAFALGMVLSGSVGDRLARRFGRARLFWVGSGGMAVAGMLFILGQSAPITIGSTFVMGVMGTLTLVMIQSTLSDHHRDNRRLALTESNLSASVSAAFLPLLVGGFQQAGIGWRAGLVVGSAFWLVLLLVFRTVSVPRAIPAESQTENTSPSRLPMVFWAYALVLFMAVSVEWSVIFWGADFLHQEIGLSKTSAATLMSVFFVAVIVGRALGSVLVRHFALQRLLLGTLLLVMVGFVPFWLAPLTGVNLVGLFIVGLGISNLFPLGLSMATSVVLPDQSDAASGGISLSTGLAILLAPQLLGTLADSFGIGGAYAVVAVLLVVSAGVVGWANQLSEV